MAKERASGDPHGSQSTPSSQWGPKPFFLTSIHLLKVLQCLLPPASTGPLKLFVIVSAQIDDLSVLFLLTGGGGTEWWL